MAGSGTPHSAAPFDSFVDRPFIRLTTVYATPWRVDERTLNQFTRPAGEYLRLGRLAHFYNVSQNQLPRIGMRTSLDARAVTFERWNGAAHDVRMWCFALPSGQLLPGLSMDVDSTLLGVIPLLEDLYYASITIADVPFTSWCARAATERFELETPFSADLTPERHQIVFTSITGQDTVPDEDLVQRIVYRADLPVRPGGSSISYPAELNRRPTTRGALGPYVSVIAGNQDYVENAILLSAVQGVASLAALRGIRHRAYGCLELLKAQAADNAPGAVRLTLEDVADTVADLEVALSVEAEAPSDLGMLVPSLRVESYHRALFEEMRIEHGATTTGRMLERLRNAVRSELDKVQSIEQRAEDARRLRTAVAVTFVTTVGGTLSLLFGFFGMNASQVDGGRSMFDSRYAGIYVTILLIVAVAGLVFTLMTWTDRRRTSRHRTGVPHLVPASRTPAPTQQSPAPAPAGDATILEA